jgi:hypothetical protein
VDHGIQPPIRPKPSGHHKQFDEDCLRYIALCLFADADWWPYCVAVPFGWGDDELSEDRFSLPAISRPR